MEARICRSCGHAIQPGETHFTWLEATEMRARRESKTIKYAAAAHESWKDKASRFLAGHFGINRKVPTLES